MAKAKKSDTGAKSGGARKSAKAKSAGAGAGGGEAEMPVIDTNLAAESAAKMLSAKKPQEAAAAGGGAEGKDSHTIKQIKESLNRPAAFGGGTLGNLTGPKKSNLPLHGGQQRGHNQTFANFNRAGVPRRTPG
ncbi:MAG TPA: hypothetical protein VIL86_19900 [Tepidisphaeraceae bacterium]|jgi:hypothetical protein